MFVVGAGRSGTSMLRAVLDGHSQLAVAHEAGFVYPLSRRRARYERNTGFDVDAFRQDLVAQRAVRCNLGFGPDELRAALGGSEISGYADAVRRVFAHYAATLGKPRYGDKMPAYVQHIGPLAGLFPEARFVHIVRDGRDVALSNMALDGGPRDPVALALDWRQRVRAGRTAGARLGPRRYHEIRYEDLVADPVVPITELCAFLDLDFEPPMLSLTERTDRVLERVRANPRHARLAEPVSSGARSWRTHMTQRDLARFETVAGDLLEQLGYERGAPAPALTDRSAALWGRVRWNVRRAGARLPGLLRRTWRAAGGTLGRGHTPPPDAARLRPGDDEDPDQRPDG